MRNRMYGGVRGRKTKVGRKLLCFPPTRLCVNKNGVLCKLMCVNDLMFSILMHTFVVHFEHKQL